MVLLALALPVACSDSTGGTAGHDASDHADGGTPDVDAGNGGSACGWAAVRPASAPRFHFSIELAPGGKDGDGHDVGTEILNIVQHGGALYAGMGFWPGPGFQPSDLPAGVGATILTKRNAADTWHADLVLPGYLRIDALAEVSLGTDETGAAVAPVSVLIAGATDIRPEGTARTSVWQRDEASGTWAKADLSSTVRGSNGELEPYVRAFAKHKDSVTGVESVFAGAGWGAIFRGVRSAGSPAIAWQQERIFSSNSGRVMGFAEVGGVLHVSVGVEPGDNPDGGIWRRIDGPSATWERVATWPAVGLVGNQYPPVPEGCTLANRRNCRPGTLRGLTAQPIEGGGVVLLGGREDLGRISRFDPASGYQESIDFDFYQRLSTLWGGFGSTAMIAGYNDMIATDLPTLGVVRLIGLWVEAPNSVTPSGGSHAFIRTADSCYELVEVFDPAHPIPGGSLPRLRGTRSIVRAPWSNSAAPEFYFGGFDAGGNGLKSNTAWIYKGVWQ